LTIWRAVCGETCTYGSVEERSLPVKALKKQKNKKKEFNHGAGSRSNYTPNVEFAFNSLEHDQIITRLFSVGQLKANICASVIRAKA
jgi:hypothetical protein